MKLLALQNANRRSNSFRGASVLDGASDGGKSPAVLFWLILHGLCCLISLILGFRFSRLVFFFLFSPTSNRISSDNYTPFLTTASDAVAAMTVRATPSNNGFDSGPVTIDVNGGAVSGSRVVVGRHGIRIRPWPHPNPEEVMKAHKILERVQKQQRIQYGVKNPRSLIVVTPTYVRTFQTIHLTGVMHSLMNAPYKVIWIVVEAGGMTSETASLLEKSGIEFIHVGFDQKMPITWADRYRLEDQMRHQALRVVRERRLDGVVMFADDSNMHSLELFDEVQKVNWVGVVSVGILVHSGDADETMRIDKLEDEANSLPIQGPACNASEALVGWHTFNLLPYSDRRAVFIGDQGTVLPRKFEWAGLVLNSRLLWKDDVDKPEWFKDIDSVSGEELESPLSLLKDSSMVEPLGHCGRKVLLWWLRVEARSDSKFPPRWIIDPPSELTVPAKRTPWPDAPPELPTNMQKVGVDEHTEKRPPKARSSRSKRRSKRKHEARGAEMQRKPVEQ